MPLLANVYINTARAQRSNGMTMPEQPYLSGVLASALPTQSTLSAYKVLPDAALQSDYTVRVDSGVDVREGDIVTAITLLDGVTPWPSVGLASNSLTNETLRVSFATESAPGPLAHRLVYVTRERAGGVVY